MSIRIGVGIWIGRNRGVSFSFTPAQAPSGLTLTVISDTEIQLDWTTNSAGLEDGFGIERSPDNATWVEIDTTLTGIVHYHDVTCVAGTLYYYRVRAYKGTSYSDYSNTAFGYTWATEYLTVKAAFTTQPSNADANIQNTWLCKMIAGGYFAKAEFLDLFSTHTNNNSEALINWHNPGTFNPTLTNAPTFTAYQGFLGNAAATKMVGLNYTAWSNHINITTTSICAIIGIGTHLDEARFDFGAGDTGRHLRICSLTGATMVVTANGVDVSVDNQYGKGHFAFSKDVLNAADIYNNFTKINKAITGGAALCTNPLWAAGNNASASTRELRYAFLFSYLTEAEVLDVIEITEEYLRNYSTNLITYNNITHSVLERVSNVSLYKGILPNAWLGRPLLSDNALGEWIMLYRHAYNHASTDSTSVHHIRFSNDEGVTWSDADKLIGGAAVTNAPFVLEGGNNNQADALLIRCPNDDLLVIIYETGGTAGGYQWRSTDDGATWVSEGRILGNTYINVCDWTTVGSDIYMPVRTGTTPDDLLLYKSTNNGTSWVFVANIETVLDCNEAGICYLEGNNLIVIMKDSDGLHTWKYTSTDLGLNWSRTDVTATLGILNHPKMLKLNGNLLLFGRDLLGAYIHYTCVYVSSDNGVTWSEVFYPDPYSYADAGYCDMVQRSDGTYYMLSYAGIVSVSYIKEYTFRDL